MYIGSYAERLSACVQRSGGAEHPWRVLYLHCDTMKVESCNQSLQIIATYGVYSVMLLCDMELDYVKCLIRVQCKVTSL